MQAASPSACAHRPERAVTPLSGVHEVCRYVLHGCMVGCVRTSHAAAHARASWHVRMWAPRHVGSNVALKALALTTRNSRLPPGPTKVQAKHALGLAFYAATGCACSAAALGRRRPGASRLLLGGHCRGQRRGGAALRRRWSGATWQEQSYLKGRRVVQLARRRGQGGDSCSHL